MSIGSEALKMHERWKGKLKVCPKVNIKDRGDLSLAYTPGVAQPCLEIAARPERSYDLTGRQNCVAVITDGTAVLGLGDIGPLAAMPVMEGKCLLFSQFAGIDAIPLCVGAKDPDEFVRTVSLLTSSFGGINLEDISAPRCFEIERKLKEICDIPVFHDDQHGTAIVVLAALMNALKVVGKEKEGLRVVINGAGAAGTAIGRLLLSWGIGDLIFVDRAGAIVEGAPQAHEEHERLAKISNPRRLRGALADVLPGADVFIGVSRPGLLTREMIGAMAKDPIIFAMANPTPEIMPEEAIAAGARVVGTGRSDYPNQINNLLAFPGVFRGALDCRAAEINEEMKRAAAYALAALIPDEQRSETSILPDVFDPRVVDAVSAAVMNAARETGAARKP